MTVFVDDAKNPFGRMIMCHMRADTLDELHAMAVKIGVSRRHFQDHPRHPHYDICKSKREMAIDKFGAKSVTGVEMVRYFDGWREKHG